jgi:hypothetical protein
MVKQRRRWLRWPGYVIAGVLLAGLAALTASAGVRASTAQWLLDVTDVESTAPDDAGSPGDRTGGAPADPDLQDAADQADERAARAAEEVRKGLPADHPARLDPQRDVAACALIGEAASRHRDGELTLRGYAAELERAAEAAAPGGEVARHATASLEAIVDQDADADVRAREDLADACALAAALASD